MGICGSIASWLLRSVILALVGALLFSAQANAQRAGSDGPQPVYFAGYGYASASADVSKLFPHISAALDGADVNFDHILYADLSKKRDFGSFRVVGDEKGKLGAGTGALVVALVLDQESTAISQIGDQFKILATVSFSAMVFDFDSSEVLSAVPMTLRYVDLVPSRPDSDYVQSLFQRLVIGEQAQSVRSNFWLSLDDTIIPQTGARRVRVTPVSVPSEVAWADAEALRAFGDDAGGALSRYVSKQFRIATLPYSNSQVISGKMTERIGNGEVFDFKIPSEDYALELSLDAFKKINTASNSVGDVFVYGVFATVAIKEPLTQRTLFQGTFKQGETRTVPASVIDAPDSGAFDAVTTILLESLVLATHQADRKWEKAHTADDRDAVSSIIKFKEILDSCR